MRSGRRETTLKEAPRNISAETRTPDVSRKILDQGECRLCTVLIHCDDSVSGLPTKMPP